MTRRQLVVALIAAALVAAIVITFALPVTRTPAFHRYADQRGWLAIPHVGDVLSNVPFVVAAVWALRRAQTWIARLACAAVAAIGVGSATYHVAPGDLTLAFDWGPIALGLMWMTAAVIEDRLGERAGRIALGVGAVLAIGSVVAWIAGGGTGGIIVDGIDADSRRGSVTPYGAVQALGIALPALIALVAPGRIPRVPLLVAVLLFALARLCAANDRQLLDAIGISGHSLKHVVAAAAAACALGAITSRARRASPSSS